MIPAGVGFEYDCIYKCAFYHLFLLILSLSLSLSCLCRYLLSHKTLLLELYEELGVTPCATLSPGPTPAHAMPSVLAPLSSAATISLAERTLSRDSKVEEAGK